jgi:hypothetical protein
MPRRSVSRHRRSGAEQGAQLTRFVGPRRAVGAPVGLCLLDLRGGAGSPATLLVGGGGEEQDGLDGDEVGAEVLLLDHPVEVVDAGEVGAAVARALGEEPLSAEPVALVEPVARSVVGGPVEGGVVEVLGPGRAHMDAEQGLDRRPDVGQEWRHGVHRLEADDLLGVGQQGDAAGDVERSPHQGEHGLGHLRRGPVDLVEDHHRSPTRGEEVVEGALGEQVEGP